MQLYFPFIESEIAKVFNALNEKDKRLYAAVEVFKIGHGGISYISRIVGCSRKLVARGVRELLVLPTVNDRNERIRLLGGGRKRYSEKHPNIDAQFLSVIKDHTAGDPMNVDIKWTNLTPKEISEKLNEKHNVGVSESVVRQLLAKHKFKRRKAQKSKTAKNVKNRDEQFKNIAKLKAEYMATENPIISIDTKKKEMIGNFYREGRLYTQEVIEVNDHDFNSLAEGVVIPHGIYDLKQNTGYINIGTSKDTSEFACDSIKNWWHKQGKFDYPNASSILMLCDGGGSNNCRHYIFKYDLQRLTDEIGIEIRVAHYPPYTSKYNPIEHRLFSHVTRACQGVVFKSIKIVKELIGKTKTNTGLKVWVEIIEKTYETGRAVDEDFKKNMRIIFDEYLPFWNYKAIPERT